MTNASLGPNDIRKIDDDVEEENYGRCESPVLSKVLHRSQRSIKEMTPDDPELVETARKAVIPLLATPQSLTAFDLATTVPVEQSAINPSFSIEANLVPSTAKIPESLCDLLNFENTSWTSSLATPHGRNVTYSNLNTEEKKVLVSSNAVPRTLFTPEVKEEQSQKSLNESFMECSEILPSAEPNKLCKGYKEFSTSEIFSSNESLQNTTVLTGVEKYSDISLGCSTSVKEPRLVREVLDLLVSPVTSSRQKIYSEAESLSETPSHSSNYKYDHEFGKLSKLRPKAKRLFRKGKETCSVKESDTTINGDQMNNGTDCSTVDKSKECPISPNLSDSFIFASPISPVLKVKADEKQQKGDSMSCSPILHKTQEFLHDFSFSTLEEVCQASEVLASGCNSPVEITDNFLSQKREPYTAQNVSPIQSGQLPCHNSNLLVNKTSTPIHTERDKKVWANKKKIKFLNIHQEQKYDSFVKEHEEKLDILCENQVTLQNSDVVEQITKYDSDPLQHGDTPINKNRCTELNNIRPDSTESLRNRVFSVKSNTKQKKKFAYFSELDTCNTVNITRFPFVDTILSNMLQSAAALEAVSLLQNEKNSSSVKKHLEQMYRTGTDFVPFNKLSVASAGQHSTARNSVKTYNSLKNISEEESKINLDNALCKTVGVHTTISGRKRKSGSHGILGDQCIAKRTCIKEVKSVQVSDVLRRPDSNYLQPYVSDTQLNVVFDNVEAIVAQSNSKCNILGTVDGSCSEHDLSNFHAENKCQNSLLENVNAFPNKSYVDNGNIRAERSNLNNEKSITESFNVDKNEIYLLGYPTELKNQNHYNLKCKIPDSETSSENSRNLDNQLKKETDASENILLGRGSTKTDSITQNSDVKQVIPKVCKFNCLEMEECPSEEPVTEACNETSFLNSHQHIFDSSFTDVTQRTTNLVGKERTKEEALPDCEQNNSFVCNIIDETRKESLVMGPTQHLLQNTNEDTANKGKPAECTPYTECNKKGSFNFCINSESNNVSENESSYQQSHMPNTRQVFHKTYNTIIDSAICKAGSLSLKNEINGSLVNEDLKEGCKLLAFSCDRQNERLPCTDKCLQVQSTDAGSSMDNGEEGLCAQSNILGIKVLNGSDHGMFFTTAKGKKIETSKKCLDLAHNLFRDILEPNIEQLDGQDVYTTQQKSITKTVAINDEDLPKLKVLKNNNTKNCKENYEKNDNSEMQDSRMESLNVVNKSSTDAVPLHVGFSTASGKKFTVSENSLHKARHIFQTVMELENIGDDIPLKDYDLFSVRGGDTTPSSNTNFQRCTENAMILSEQFQKKLESGADASSNGKILGHAGIPESVRVKQTVLSKDKDISVTVDSNSSILKKQLDETEKQSLKLKTNHSEVSNDEQKDIIMLTQESKSSESLLEIDSGTTDKNEFDVKCKTFESEFTTAARGRISDKGVHEVKKILPNIVSQHSSENTVYNTGKENLSESAYEEKNDPDDATFSDYKGPLPKTSSYEILQAMLDVEGSNKLLNSEYDALCANNLLVDCSTLTGSLLEDTKTTFVTRAESDVTPSQAFIKIEDNCSRSKTEVANAEVCKGLGSESILNRGFVTAAGRNVTVSDASLNRAKSLLSDISVLNEDDCKNIVPQVKGRALNNSLMSQEKHKHYVLQKGHVKKVNTGMQGEHSEELKAGRKVSLKGRNLIESLNRSIIPETAEQTKLRANKCPEDISIMPEQVAKVNFNCGFHTAAGKPLEISLASLSKVGEMFEDIMVPVTKGYDYTLESHKNADTISPLAERNISEDDDFMKTLDTNVIERKMGSNFSPEKNDTFNSVIAIGRDVEISQLSLQDVKKTFTVHGTSLDKMKEALFNKMKLTEQISVVGSEGEIKTLDKKRYSVCKKTSKMCGGFVTASGKQVDVSEESLMRVRNMFSDTTENVEETTMTAGNMEGKEAIEGSTSKGKTNKKMKNSSQHRSIEMKKIFSTESKNESQICPNNKNAIDLRRLNVCGSFVTAGGKKVDVSEESLMKVRNLFSDITENFEETTLAPENMKGKEGKMKNSSQDKTIEYNNESQICPNKANSMDFKRLNMCGGFVTAGGKKVDVSEESLMKVRNLFSSLTDNVEETTLTVGNMNEKEAIQGSSFKGKNVLPLKEMKKSSQDRSVEYKNESQICPNETNLMDFKRLNVCGGFVTAGGKKVDVSEECLMKVRNLFSDITENVEETTLFAGNIKGKEPIEKYSYKVRDISTEKMRAIEEVTMEERIMEQEKIPDTESKYEVQFLDKIKNSPNCKRLNMSVGFTTARGKKINVSEESLARVKNLFSDTSENVENNSSVLENMKLKGVPEIYSSNKEEIKSTKKMNNLSLIRNMRTKKISDGELQNELKWLDKKEKSVPCENLNMFGGFVTGGGRKVGVSEESLARARNLFSDITEKVEETSLILRNVKEEESTAIKCNNNKNILSFDKMKSLSDMSTGTRKISETDCENKVNLLDEEENSISSKNLNMFGDFVAAGGKKMEFSEESLVRSRNLFSDFTENVRENTLAVENTEEKEWQCLENNKVLSLATGEGPLADQTTGTKKIPGSESDSEIKPFHNKHNVMDDKRLKMYGGFVTGCGKKVEVSEQSLAKVRSLFSDITDNEENSSVVSRNLGSTSSDMKRSCMVDTDGLQNEFLAMETHLHTSYQEPKAKGARESMPTLDIKKYVSATPTSNKPHDNAPLVKVLQHNTKINVATKLIFEKHEPTLTQEVSESTAALLLDDDFKKELEESDSSCFSMLTERSCSPDLSVALGSASNIEREPGSPVIGSKNKCNRANKVPTRRHTTAKRAERTPASLENICDQSRFEDKNDTPSFVPEVNNRRKRCSSIKDNQIHKKQRMCNTGLNENLGEPTAAKIKAQVIPSPGIWLQLRMSDQKQCVQWRDISDGNSPSQFTESELLQCGVRKSVINVTSTTAEFFKFSASDLYREGNYQSLQAGEDVSLEFDADGFAGVQEVEKAFLTNPNVDKSLIPAGWIQNHYRWIVWKLAATERSFPHIYASRYLTPRVLLLQLKYRYDREIDRCQRPALRRIMEHDDSPGKRMVLCVADVIKPEETQEETGKEGSRQCSKMCNYELELTDGWYSIRCTVDMEMCHLIEAGRVAIGTKLVTHSAELVNCEQPCPPLEAGPSVRLKIHTNSTRRARWDYRLGYCRQPGPLPVCLMSLKPAGGIISCVTAAIARVYPIVYMEKGPDGKAEFYSAKQEALRASKRERQWQEHIEKLYSQERAQLSQLEWFSTCSQQSKPKGMSKKHITTPTRQQLAAATCAEDLCQLLCNAPDPASLQSLLTEEQRDAVANYQQMRQQQLLQELEARVRKRLEEERNATSSLALLKVRCVDAKECSARSAVLSIWRPSEDLLTLFQEGSVLKLFSIMANGLRNGDLQLSACRQSRYQPQSCQLPKDFPARCVTPLSQVSSGNLKVPFGELDCVGVVVHVAPLSGNYQTVYIADADMDIVGISFWNGLKGSGWEDILTQKALVACSNLQSRVGAAVHWIPTTYATEFSIFSQHPRQKHLIEALDSLRRNLNMDIDNFSYTCEGIVLSFLNEQIVTPVRNASLNVRQTKPSTAELSRVNSPNVTPELSEKVQRRLFKLEQYGEPPSLSPLALVPRSRVLKKSFHVPLKADRTAELSCDDSPPMSLDSDEN